MPKLTKLQKLQHALDDSYKGPQPYSPYCNGYRDGLHYAMALLRRPLRKKKRS